MYLSYKPLPRKEEMQSKGAKLRGRNQELRRQMAQEKGKGLTGMGPRATAVYEAGPCQDAKKKALTQQEGTERRIRQLRTARGKRVFKQLSQEKT